MAAWGMGDPRWVVQDRKDGSNVNGWHWEERNRVAWSKQRLAELLVSGLPPAQMDATLGHASITQLKDCSGEAYQTLRKGNKKFAIYDLSITLEWEGRCAKSNKEVKGQISITELCSTNEPEEWIITVTATDAGAAQDSLRAAVQESLRPVIMQQLAMYVDELSSF